MFGLHFHDFQLALFNYLKLQLAQKSTTLITKSKRIILNAGRNCSDERLISTGNVNAARSRVA